MQGSVRNFDIKKKIFLLQTVFNVILCTFYIHEISQWHIFETLVPQKLKKKYTIIFKSLKEML
jgi:hypothetical protein